MKLFATLSKVEEQPDGSIKVFGIASSGARDEAGEIIRPEAMKAALPEYMKWGAIREMHQSTGAAGTALEARVDEDGMTQIVAHVVDPVAVSKVRSGVYKGFSIGGKVLKRDPKDPSVITAIRLVETSLVDRPCNPEAEISMWKVGEADDPPPPANAVVKALALTLARAAGKPDRPQDFLQKARAELLARAAAASPDPSPEGDAEGDDDGEDEDGAEDSHAGAPAADDEDEAPEPAPAPLRKAGRRNSAKDQASIQACHDQLVGLGAVCSQDAGGDGCADDQADAPDPADGFGKIAGAALAKAALRIDVLARRLDEQARELALLKSQPLPAKTAASSHAAIAVDKVVDAGGQSWRPLSAPSPDEVQKALDALPETERVDLLMRAALSRPIPIGS